MPTLATSLQQSTGIPSYIPAIQQEKEVVGSQIEKKEVKVTICS